MIGGLSQLCLNMFSLLGVIILLILIIGFLGVLKDFVKALFIRGKMSIIYRKLKKIEKCANEILKDFHKGASFMGLAKTEMLGEELKELDELIKEANEDNKKRA